MSYVRSGLGAGLLLLAAAALIQGCGSASPELQGAVYAEQIPVYQSARVTGMIGGVSSDLDGGDPFHQASWWLETSDSREDIEAWYESQLPNVSKITEDWGDGPVTVYSWVPEGGKPGEELTIVITNDDIQVTETIQGMREDR